MYKKSWLNYLCDAVCVEFQQVQYIHLSEIVHALKAVAVALHCDSCILKLVDNFVVTNFLSAKESAALNEC